MTGVTQTVPFDPMIRAAGGFAIISGIISAVGVVFLVTMFVLFARSNQAQGEMIGMLNDICVALQYLLTIPIALALYRILLPHNPSLIRLGTIIGILSMLVVIALQLALIFGVLTFQQQAVWVSLAIIMGVGAWLLITGLVARSASVFPNSVLMSAIAVPYFGYPVYVFWLGRQLLGF
jgi:hypothetical protein